jgi:cytosine/adenosine deaminase-related metal-dependent hydrolase
MLSCAMLKRAFVATGLLAFLVQSSPFRAQTAAPKTAGEMRYTLILSGNNAGFETITQNPDGSLKVHYEFNDRGRGPKIDQVIEVSKSGLPVRTQSTGVDYMKAPVTESFSLKGGNATWKNRAENGQKTVKGDAFYSSVSGTPEEGMLLTRALLKAPAHKLALLPAGEVSLEKKSEVTVTVNNQPQTMVLYWITGLGFTPGPIWLTKDGKYGASVSAWFSQVPEGWEAAIDPLIKEQNKFEQMRSGELARSLGHKPVKPLVFTHARLFDSEAATSLNGQTVVITGNKITAVGEDGKVQLPAGAQVVDAGGKTLMPGLWDMHVHVQPNDGILHIANGVTSVRDMANDTEELMKTRDRFDQGTEIGPRVIMAGFIDGRGPYQGPTKVFADNEEEARKDVDNYARLGYVQIKVYSSLKPELVPKIAEMAHGHGMRLSGHVPAGMTAEQFVLAGADEIQHMNFIFLNFMPQVKDTRTPARFVEPAQHAAEIDPSSDQAKAFIKLLQDHKTVIDPTLSIFEDMFTDRAGTMPEGWATVAQRMPSEVRRGLLYGGIEVPDGMDQRYRDSFKQFENMAKAFYDSGVPIVAGTDALAGFALHRELEIYGEAGIPAPKVLQLATIGAARIMKRDQEVGSIKPGKLADVILVDGDPAMKLSDLDRVETVVKDGVVYKVADLDRALGVQPFTH